MPKVAFLFVLLRRGPIPLDPAVFVGQRVILLLEPQRLLLQSGNVLITALDLTLEARDLPSVTGHGKLLGLLGVLVGPLVLLDLLLQTQNFEDHNVGAVEDKREEKREAAEVHVALRVKLAGLHFETLVSHNCRSIRSQLSQPICKLSYKLAFEGVHVRLRRIAAVLSGSRQFELNPIHAVDTINEENQDEDKCDLQPVLDFSNDGVLRDKATRAVVSLDVHEAVRGGRLAEPT